MQDPRYGQNINAFDDHPWSEQYYRNIADGVLTVPDGLSVESYVSQLVIVDVLAYSVNGDNYGNYHKAMALIGGAEAAEMFYIMLYANDETAGQAYVYAHADGDLLDEIQVSTHPPIKPGSSRGETSRKRFPERIRQQAFEENPNQICVYCRQSGVATQVDHAIPKARGGNATIDNAQLTCPHCNASKGARTQPVNPPPGYDGP